MTPQRLACVPARPDRPTEPDGPPSQVAAAGVGPPSRRESLRAGGPSRGRPGRTPRVTLRRFAVRRPPGEQHVTSARLLAVLALVLMAVADTKVRVRGSASSVSGHVDGYVVAEVGLFVGIAAVVIGMYPGRRFFAHRFGPTSAIAILFVADLLLSALYSPFPALAAVRACETFVWCALAVQLWEFGGLETLHRLAHSFVIMICAATFIGFVSREPSAALETTRFSWLSVHPVVAASWLGISATILVAYLLAATGGNTIALWHPNVYLMLLVGQVAALIATGTRGAVAAFACAALTVAVGHVSARRRLEFLVVVAILSAIAWLTASGPISSFAARGESAARLASLNGRTELWALAWTTIKQAPWFGHGLTASRGLFLDRTTLGGGHNAAVNVLVDQGFLGLGLYALLCLALLLSLTRLPVGLRAHAWAPLGVVVFLMAHGLTVEYMVAPATTSFAWFLLVVVWAGLIRRHPAAARRKA